MATPISRHLSTARFIACTDTGWPSDRSASIRAVAGPSFTAFHIGRMLSRPLRNSLSYVGSIEMPCESTPRRSVSAIMSAVVLACSSDMPQARNTVVRWPLIFSAGTRISHGLLDRVDAAWIVQRGQVARLLPEVRRADDPAHDLCASRLRQLAREEHTVGTDRLAHCLRHVLLQIPAQDVGGREPGTEHREADHRLALDLVWHADGRGLVDRGVPHEDRLDLRRTHALAGDLERVVRAAVDEPVAVLVDVRPGSVHPHVRPSRPVRFEIAVRVVPEAVGHPGPRSRDHQLPDLTAHGLPVLAVAIGGHPRDGPVEGA